MALLHEWWVWMAAGIVLAIAEIFLPGYVFLGFALGAVFMGIVMAIGAPLAFAVATLPRILLLFALASLAAWLLLRRLFGFRNAGEKVFDEDINRN